jgi:thiol peroxidase
MARSTLFKGSPLALVGQEIKVGQKMPSFKLTGTNMEDVSDAMFKGKKLVIVSVPSLDTPVCSIEVKRFNQEAATLAKDVAILTVSYDLPFAQKRWCGAEGVTQVITASEYKYRKFGEDFGTLIQDWGLLSRAIFVVDSKGTVQYVEYVPEVSEEPKYAAALGAVAALS